MIALSILFHALLFQGLKLLQSELIFKKAPPPPTWLKLEEDRENPMSDRVRRSKKDTVTKPVKDAADISRDLITVPTPGESTRQDRPASQRGPEKGAQTLAQALHNPTNVPGDIAFRAAPGSLVPPEVQQQVKGFLPEDISVGDIISLNTDQSIYYSFHRRIGEKVIWPWAQNIQNAYHQLKSQGVLGPTSKSWRTVIEVVMEKDGTIISVQPLQLSGDFLIDSAPSKAFTQAKKIPNPPKGLIDEEGYIHLTFQFTVYYDPRPKF